MPPQGSVESRHTRGLSRPEGFGAAPKTLYSDSVTAGQCVGVPLLAGVTMMALKGPAWYRLHFSTWVILAAYVALATVIVAPGISIGAGFPYPTLYEHGCPFVCLHRVSWPSGGPVPADCWRDTLDSREPLVWEAALDEPR
jgi:hypothetical protein